MNKIFKRFLSAVIVTAMAATMVVLPITAQAAVVESGCPDLAYACEMVTVRETELRVPDAAGNDDLRSAERRPPPHR